MFIDFLHRSVIDHINCYYFRLMTIQSEKIKAVRPSSTADDWPKVLSLRTLLVRSVQHLVAYTKMFVCMSSFRIRLMTCR